MKTALRDIVGALRDIARELRKLRSETEIAWMQISAAIRESSPETARRNWLDRPRPENID